MRIDIWSDVVCPWCYLGARRLDAALDQVGRSDIEVRWRAFQLDPGAPTEPGDLRAALERKYGPGAFDAMTERLEGLGREAGIDYRFDRALRVNTADAHRLIAWAGSGDEMGAAGGSGAGGGPGGAGTADASTIMQQSRLVDRLFDDYFTQGADIGRHDTLVDAAASVGLDRDLAAEMLVSGSWSEQIRADQASAHERGISGVPAFVIDDDWIIPGAQDTDRLVQLLQRVRDR